ncbi:undecaprenyl pyrophosphate synthase [Methylocella tundrae]|uniref:Isoprenyl transferase n=1 Tax=Methylocella tundrae TaxID=227605 RepID=A0A4U8YWC3_METTU|nr:isoprenyl transferase [Methylocella tundrae]WPP04979.1 isoprenyl transferase [Methylocella tundrae]VFU07270.1 undecaprenyl pyrophosphate synthase [Methylocella tundrae]VTZ49772.1 undecaprenyl pyrophosphate synthase [Methylocella tundrae]
MHSMISDKPALAAQQRPFGAPAHVGVIMDGNGRWAASRGLPRLEGHRRGLEALRGAVRAAIDFGLDYLTVYSFSMENWSRPMQEVADLMGLLKRFIRHDLSDLDKANVKIRVIGRRDDLQEDIRTLLVEAEEATSANTGLNLVVAFNYGARQEIAAAARALAEDVAAGRVKACDIDETLFAQRLDTAGIPDPDLIIRTSGEKRLSNFLMWQAAYSEFVFLPMHWPDFDRKAFAAALAEFGSRERRFGGVTPAVEAGKART